MSGFLVKMVKFYSVEESKIVAEIMSFFVQPCRAFLPAQGKNIVLEERFGSVEDMGQYCVELVFPVRLDPSNGAMTHYYSTEGTMHYVYVKTETGITLTRAEIEGERLIKPARGRQLATYHYNDRVKEMGRTLTKLVDEFDIMLAKSREKS